MISSYIIHENASVKQAIELLDKNNGKSVFVTDTSGHLKGIFTQGDMRRYILHSTDLSDTIENAMNSHPIVFKSRNEALQAKMKKNMVVYPIVNEEGILIDALFKEQKPDEINKCSNALKEVPLVIMAGGKGTRLYPYTKVLPKALIPIGDYTITERIIKNFCNYGCQEVYFVLNHKANMVKAYFDDLDKNYIVHYVKENQYLGTGGGLSLLKKEIHNTFILSNCDILIKDDLECIYRTHKKNKNKITFVCAMKNIVIPYGVVNVDRKGDISDICEKPEVSFLTNTGVYIIEPEVIQSLEDNKFIHLPDIAQRYIKAGERVGVFPVSEQSWMDMGQFSEMEQMMKHFEE